MPELCRFVLRWAATTPDLSLVCEEEAVPGEDYCPLHMEWMFGGDPECVE